MRSLQYAICSLSWNYKIIFPKDWLARWCFFMVVVAIEGLEWNILKKSENSKKESLDSPVLGLNKGNTQIKYWRKHFLQD